jgi:chaperonin cofactor prefoldin
MQSCPLHHAAGCVVHAADCEVESLFEAELVAEKILAGKSSLVDLDRKRQANREALHHLSKLPDAKVWYCIGESFVKVPKSVVQQSLTHGIVAALCLCISVHAHARAMLTDAEQEKLEKEIANVDAELKKHMRKLHELEGRPMSLIEGFELKPFTLKNVIEQPL